MERWVGKVAVVTGASAGIGAAIAVSLAKAGMIVVGLARRANRIEELKSQISGSGSGELHAYECDITKQDAVQSAFDWIENKFGGVNVLVNNAGCVVFGTLLEGDYTAKIENMVNLNLMAVIYCTKAAYKILTKTGDIGHVVNISSIAAYSVFSVDPSSMPIMNAYFGTKHALKVTTEVLRQELRFSSNKNIKISMISPGGVKTEIGDAAGVPMPPELLNDPSFPMLESEDIADWCIHVLATPPRVQIHDVIIKPAGEIN